MNDFTSRMVSVLVVAQDLKEKEEVGKLVNAAFVAGLTAGRLAPTETFGAAVVDGDGLEHARLTNIAHYVRKASQGKLRSLRREFAAAPGVTVVDYTEAAAPSSYEEYAATLARQSGDQISYRVIHVYGPEEAVVPLTKNLSRL